MTTDASSTAFRTTRGHPGRGATGAAKPDRSQSTERQPALPAGRDESRAVRRYLEALQSLRGGAPVTKSPESMARRIEAIDAQLAGSDPAVKVRLIQERMELYAQLKAVTEKGSLEELEDGFVSAAGAYSARKGISYAAWREVGVDQEVLERAGIAPPPNSGPHT